MVRCFAIRVLKRLMSNSKPSWDSIWMALAKQVSSRSNDPKFKVGAVVVTCDNESVLSLGYNGDEKGGSNSRDSLDHGKSGFIHAEVNAVAKMNYADPRNRKIYLTHSPCLVCSRLIVNSGISEVIYDNEYSADTKGLELLRQRGVAVRKY